MGSKSAVTFCPRCKRVVEAETGRGGDVEQLSMPVSGRKSRSGSSAQMRHSIAWPSRADVALRNRAEAEAGGDLQLEPHEIEAR